MRACRAGSTRRRRRAPFGPAGAWRVRGSALALAALLACAAAGPTAAQTVAGRVLEEPTGQPVEGALVELLDIDSVRVATVLSGPGGRYAVRLPPEGGEEFRLRVGRIGYATVVTPVGRTRAAREPLDVWMRVEAVSLEPLVATGAGRCVVDPRTALETATLWEEARTSLEVTALVRRERLVRFQTVRFTRSLDPGRSVLLDDDEDTGGGSRPFRSLPAARLAAEGWVQRDGEADVYYMPDPEVALSEDFLDGHCFHVAVRETGGGRQVGLAFEPLRGRRLPDVSGVLWLDAATARLRSLEYGYTNLAHEAAMEVAGGRAEFDQLADGTWVVRRWSISMPELVERRRFLDLLGGIEVARIREEGGEIVEAVGAGGRSLLVPGDLDVSGEVRTAGGDPLEGAVVRLSGTARRQVTGPDGSFRFRDLPRGDYLLTFDHPLLERLDVPSPARPFRLPGEPGPHVLEVPRGR